MELLKLPVHAAAVGFMKPTRAMRLEVLPISNGAIVGIAFGGAIVLFGVLVTIALLHTYRKHRRENGRVSGVEGGGHVDMDLKTTARPARPPEIGFQFARRLPFNPFMPLDDHDPIYHDWTGEDGLQNLPRIRSRCLSVQKGLFRIPGMRDSWPLVSNVPLSLMPRQSSTNILLSNVAAPGYEISSESKWPKRTASRNSRMTVSVSRGLPRMRTPLNDPYAPTKSPHRMRPHHRSTSENHLSTILRSTSERLKTNNKHSLTRTLTTVSRDPGPPPLKRLPSPPKRKPTASREALIESDPDESVASSVYDLLRSPSPRRRNSTRSAKMFSRRAKSPTPSTASDDSLCAAVTPDLIIPAPLTSPGKNGRRHRMRISSGEARDISGLINKESRASTLAMGGYLNVGRSLPLSAPHRISLAVDPYSSEVKSSKPIIPNNKVQGPRPLYIRKATFGQEATSERPRSFVFPLRNISGNVQPPPEKLTPPPHSSTPAPASPDPNPFPWAPQEATRTRSTQTSPSRRRGHKRSKVVRISQLTPPTSVSVVPEEPEEDISPLNFHVPNDPHVRFIDPVKSPGPSLTWKEGQRLSERPPTAATFSPSLGDHEISGRSRDNSPTLGVEGIRNIYSPTLATGYYAKSSGALEDEFFCMRYSSKAPDKTHHSHSRNFSNELFLFPGLSQPGKLVSFPPPDLTTVQRVITPPSMIPRLNSTIPTMTTPTCMKSTAATPAPPLLTIPIPGHLTGPRAEPLGRSGTLPPPRDSLQASIGMLRRMNSEISNYSSVSSPTSPQLPGPASMSNFASVTAQSPLPGDQHEHRLSRGSKHYLSVGSLQPRSPPKVPSQKRPQHGAEKRDSHRVYKERRKRRNEDMESDVTCGPIHELTPVKEVSSPVTGADGVRAADLKFSTVSNEGANRMTPTRENVGMMVGMHDSVEFNVSVEELDADEEEEQQEKAISRWSDAMPKPATRSVRRESKMEHPSPQTPPTWGWELGAVNGGLATSRLMRVGIKGGVLMGGSSDERKENEEESDRPRSFGLYDQDGFLRSSPDMRGILENGRAKRG